MSTASLLSRSYDLRAIYPTEIDEDFFFRLGYAFAVYTKHTRIAIGYDARLSGKSLAQSLMAGIANAGATAIDLGLVSTDMLGFATCASSDIESGIMVTASHNPKEYNGVKSLAHSGEPYNLKMCGAEIGEIMDHMPPFAS
jgi:phosphomannomutase